jgi:uncharacterized protein
MGKILTWVAIGLAVWAAWRLWTVSQRRVAAARERAAASGAAGGPTGEDAAPKRPGTPELMMRCAVCGVHLPGSEARFAGGRVYCGDAHRDADAAARGDT